MLIEYLIKRIVLFDDKIQIQLNTPLNESPDESLGFSFNAKTVSISYKVPFRSNLVKYEFEIEMYIWWLRLFIPHFLWREPRRSVHTGNKGETLQPVLNAFERVFVCLVAFKPTTLLSHVKELLRHKPPIKTQIFLLLINFYLSFYLLKNS